MANQKVLFLTKFDSNNAHLGKATSVRASLKELDRDGAVALLDGSEELHVIDSVSDGGGVSLYKGGATVAIELPDTMLDGEAPSLADVQMFAIMTSGFMPLVWEGSNEGGLELSSLPPGALTYADVVQAAG